MIKVSVIVPIYNMEKYLKQCLDSIVTQTLQEKEIICINDGSTDQSGDILKDYAKEYPYITVINQPNSGVAFSRNLGIRTAQGEFVCFIDPDDWYPETDILEYLYKNAKKEKVLICGGSFSSDYFGNVKTFYDGMKEGYTFLEDAKIKYRHYQWDYGYHRFIYQREMLIAHNIIFPNYIRYQDPPFFVKSMLQADEFYAVKKITYRYRLGHQSFIWNENRTKDLLKGLIDNLEISKTHGLAKLHYNTVYRLDHDFYNPIKNNLEAGSNEIENLLYKVDECIDHWLLQMVDNNISSLFQPEVIKTLYNKPQISKL